MIILSMSRPYWSDGSYWVNFRYKTGTSEGQGRIEASSKKIVLTLAANLSRSFNNDYATS